MKRELDRQTDQIEVTIYRFTGKQGFFIVPKKWCEECDLLVETVKNTIADLGLDKKVKLKIKPWWLWFWQPFFSNLALHAPILIINGKLVSQGNVPDKQTLTKALRQGLEKNFRRKEMYLNG